MMRCQTQGMCAPHGGCSAGVLNETSALDVACSNMPPMADLGEFVDYVWNLKQGRDQLRAEVEALRKDAARLDWLDGYIVIAEHEDTGKFTFNSIKGALRECVDAAMAAKEA